jgi:hypothetical protein
LNYLKDGEEICSVCKAVSEQSSRAVARGKRVKKERLIPRKNIAFKCNYCDGGIEQNKIGFLGICSKDLIRNNIEIENKRWCSAERCLCKNYLDGKIKYQDIVDEIKVNQGAICYESHLLLDWYMEAGWTIKEGRPMTMAHIQTNSLGIFTTRRPQDDESKRFIFAVFLIERQEEGDGVATAGSVNADPKYKLQLTEQQAEKILFWNYHANKNAPKKIYWGTGLFRYLSDTEAVQVLRDIVKIKIGTADETLSKEFLNHFCAVNKIDIQGVGESNGALALRSKI